MNLLRVIDNSNVVDINQNKNPIALGDLRDVFIYKEALYVSDATSNQVHIFNAQFEYVKSFPEM